MDQEKKNDEKKLVKNKNVDYVINCKDLDTNVSEFEKTFLMLYNNKAQTEKNFAWTQNGKYRSPAESCTTTQQCLDHFLSQPIKPHILPTIALNLQNIQPEPFICIDIDNALVGQTIKRLLNDPSKKTLFYNIFQNPFIVETATPDHFHLYYKRPKESFYIQTLKKEYCTRLGFRAEFCFEQITFAAKDRKILNRNFNILDVSVLPRSLWPFNYFTFFQKGQTFNDLLTTDLMNNHSAKPNSRIPKLRNSTILKFVGQENFSQDQISMIYEFCCEGFVSMSDLKGLSNKYSNNETPTPKWDTFEFIRKVQDSTSNVKPKVMVEESKSAPIKETVEIIDFEESTLDYRTPDGYTNTKLKYTSLVNQGIITKKDAFLFQEFKFHPDRFKQALLKKTDILVISFIAYLEFNKDIFIPDQKWLGLSLEATVLNYLSDYLEFHVRFLEEEESWYIYKDRYWEIAGEDDVMGLVFQIVTENVKFGGIESRMKKNDTLNLLKPLKSIPVWPLPVPGFNFLDCVLTFNNNQEFRVPHNPKYNYRNVIATNSQPKPFSPEEMRFLLDFTGQNIILLNLIRYIIWSALTNASNNIGVYFYGPPGASKSTIYNILEEILPKKCSTINTKIIAINPFEMMGKIRGRNIINVPDISRTTLADDVIRTLNTALGRDPLPGQEKFKSKLSDFRFKGIILVQSNFAANVLKPFQERSVQDRFLVFPTIAITPKYQVPGLDQQMKDATDNFQALVHWALRMPLEIAQEYQRVGVINDFLTPEKTPVDSFGFNYLVKQINSKIDFKVLYERFKTFVIEEFSTDENRMPKGFNKSYFREKFSDFYTKTVSTEKTYRRHGSGSSVTYVKDINFKPESNALKDTQEELMFNVNESSIELLKQNPFKYPEILYFDSRKGYILFKNLLPNLQISAQICAKLAYNLSLAHLFGQFIEDHQPNNHLLYSSNARNVPGPSLNTLDFWAKYPNFPIPRLPEETEDLKNLYIYFTKKIENPNSTIALPEFKVLNSEQVKILEPEFQKLLPLDKPKPNESSNQESLKIPPSDSKKSNNTDNYLVEIIENFELKEGDPYFWPYQFKKLTQEGLNELNNTLNAVSDSGPPDLTFTLSESPKNFAKVNNAEVTLGISDALDSFYQNYHYDGLPELKSISEDDKKREQILNEWLSKITPRQFSYFQRKQYTDFIKSRLKLNSDFLLFLESYSLFQQEQFETMPEISNMLYAEQIKTMINLDEKAPFAQKFLHQAVGYSSYLKPYTFAIDFEEAIMLYNLSPIYYFGNFIRLINLICLPAVNKAWEFVKLQKQEILPENSRFKTNLPGSSLSSKSETKTYLIEQIENYLNSNNTVYNKTKLNYILNQIKTEGFDPQSLFAWGYRKADLGYGRVISIPGTTISNLGTNIKHMILHKLSELSLGFLEIDLKACHTVFFKTFFARKDAQIRKIPLSEFWPKFIYQFKERLFLNRSPFKDTKLGSQLISWSDAQMKAFLKSQWYKALNGGNCFKCYDALNDNKQILGLTNDVSITDLARDLEPILEKVPMFQDVNNFQKDLYTHDFIYLPTQVEPFDTRLLIQKSGKGSKWGIEARLYSSLEMSLILILDSVIAKNNLTKSIIPISYEQDGLLLCGRGGQKWSTMVDSLMGEFNFRANLFLKEEVILEYKFASSPVENEFFATGF